MKALIQASGGIINQLIIIVAGLALLWFFWGLTKFIFSSGSVEKHDEGKNIMIWGLVTLFVMFAIWGLVGFVGRALNIPISGPDPAGNSCIDAFGNVDVTAGDCGTFQNQ